MKTMKVVLTTALLSSVLAVLATGCGTSGSIGGNTGGGSNPPAPNLPVATPVAGTYSGNQTVTLMSTNATSIYYLSGGTTTPTCGNGGLYNGSFVVTASTTITAIGCNSTGSSPVATIGYTINPIVTVTGVNVTATPSSISTGGKATCSAVVLGTNNPPQGVIWSVTGAATTAIIDQTGVVTSTGTTSGSITCIATSTLPGYTTVFGSAVITVTAPLPTTSISALPTSVTAGNPTTLTIASTGCTSLTIVPTVLGATCNSVISVSPTATTTYAVTARGLGGSATASVTVTVTAPVPSITVACVPQSITTAIPTQCTPTYLNISSGVTYSVTGTGCAVSASGVLTSSAAGTCTVTATSTQTGFSNVSGSAQVVVTTAVPVVTGMDLPLWWECDVKCGSALFHLFGSGFAPGTTISGSPNTGVSLVSVDNSAQLTITTNFPNGYTQGKETLTVCAPGGSSCSSISIALTGNLNTVNVETGGEVSSSDQISTTWMFKKDGTSDGSVVATGNGEGFDNQTSDLLIAENAGNSSLYVIGTSQTSIGNGDIGMGASAWNGVGCITQPTAVNGGLACTNLAQSNFFFSSPSLNSAPAGSQAWVSWEGSNNSNQTIAYVYNRGTPVTISGCNVTGGNPNCALSTVLPGATPAPSLAPYVGGWSVTGFHTGPAAGLVGALPTADNKLYILNGSTLQLIGNPISVPGVPRWAFADETHGNIIVEYIDTTRMFTTFAAVNPTTGVITPIAFTASFVATGGGVSSDGTTLYAGAGKLFVAGPNQ